MHPNDAPWEQLVGRDVVLDLSSPFVVLGKLLVAGSHYFELEQADVHDLRDTQTTRERYVLECRRHGVRPNRARVWISRSEVVAMSCLSEVLVD